MTTEEYFNKIDLEKLKQEIAEFYKLSHLENISELELEKQIVKIFAVDNKIINPTYFLTIPNDVYYCRVRNNYDYVNNYLLTKKFNINELLNNPKPKIGRLNIENEKGLYLSKNLGTAIKECNIKDGDTFSVVIFKPKSELSIISTYISNKYGELSKNNKEKADLINDFVKDFLIKENQSNNTYKITNIIAKIFYKLFQSDGLMFFSSKDNKNYNLFIYNDSIPKLDSKYVFNCRMDKKDIVFGLFVEIENNKIIPRELSEKEKNEILFKIGSRIKILKE